MDLFPKKQVALRIDERLLNEFDTMRSFTTLGNRTEMIEHAMGLYLVYVRHQMMKDEDFE